MLEPDTTQEGGLTQAKIVELMTNKKLDKFGLRKKWAKWRDEGELIHAAIAAKLLGKAARQTPSFESLNLSPN